MKEEKMEEEFVCKVSELSDLRNLKGTTRKKVVKEAMRALIGLSCIVMGLAPYPTSHEVISAGIVVGGIASILSVPSLVKEIKKYRNISKVLKQKENEFKYENDLKEKLR